jgi:hypothetical protein
MKTHWTVVLILASLLLGACIPSVNPFYTEKDLLPTSGLMGAWRMTGEQPDEWMDWTFSTDDHGLVLTVVDNKETTGKFTARLFKLGSAMFLDLIPNDVKFDKTTDDLVKMAVFPGHLLARVHQLEPALKITFFDWDWLEKYLKADPKALAHHAEEGRIVLTAETRDLQAFVLAHLKEGELFGSPDKIGEFHRRPEAKSPPAQAAPAPAKP